jgi:hypothetical protein
MGLPGPDGDADQTYNVIGRLAHSFTYSLSRQPGQPFLDYCNFVLRSFGGDLAVQAWFVVVSALGVTALYCLLKGMRGASPLVGACALALHPLFLGHVGGVGDFAISLSFLIMALWAGARGWPVVAGILLALAVGCRSPLCIYVVPVGVLVWAARRKSGDAPRDALAKACYSGLIAAALSLLQFAPLFAFYGSDVLLSFDWEGWRYQLTRSGYRLLVGYGAVFWALAAALLIWLFLRLRRGLSVKGPGIIALAGGLLIAGGFATIFRVTVKGEYALPVLVGAILLFQAYAPKGWNWALLASSVAAGLVVLSPYDNLQDAYGWRLSGGGYEVMAQRARENRLQINTVHTYLANSPPRTLLIAGCRWTQDQARRAGLRKISGYDGVAGLTETYAFADLGGDRAVACFYAVDLPQLLAQVNKDAANRGISVAHDRNLNKLLHAEYHVDLAQCGRGIDLQSNTFKELWKHSGQSNVEVVDAPGPMRRPDADKAQQHLALPWWLRAERVESTMLSYSTQSTPDLAFGSSYQVAGATRVVATVSYTTSSDKVTAYSDSSPTPTTEITAVAAGAATGVASFEFEVLPGNYFRLVAAGSPALTRVVEYQ